MKSLARKLLLAALSLALSWPGAQARAEADFAGAEALSLDELDEVRGGFLTPAGLEIGFGAVVSTFVDGSLALQTRLTWTDTGPVEVLEFGALTPDLAAAAAARGIVLDGGADLAGLLIAGDGGATAVVQSLTSDHVAHLVLNNANNRDIRQMTEVTLSLPQFDTMQSDISFQAMSLRLHDAVGAALATAAIR